MRAAASGLVYLIRHGQTAWSVTGQHTSVTDLPLTEAGEAEARAVGAALSGVPFELVLVSPRQRARRTAELAGLGEHAVVEPGLVEWDYGGFEGLTGAEIAQARGEDWNLWIDGVVAGATPGEHASDVYARARAVLARVRRTVADGGNVALVAHGHILRSLGAAWVELPVIDGRKLALDTGTISILGHEHGHPAIIRWNMPPALTPAETTSSAGTPSRGTSPAPPPTTRPREE